MRLHLGVAAAAALLSPTGAYRSRVLPTDAILRADDVLSLPYASSFHPPSLLVHRQDTSPNTNSNTDIDTAAKVSANKAVKLNPNGTLNVTAWDMATNAACAASLRSLSRSSNPSGNCICYNLPSLNTATGVFEADLRLYRVSEPRDAFAGVAPGDINVGVQYRGASVSPVSMSEITGMGMVQNRTRAVVSRAETVEPQLLRTYLFVGQIHKAEMKNSMSMAAIEALIMPTFTLTAQNPNGGAVSTNVSLNEASFLTGVFAAQVVMSDFSAAQAAVDDRLAALHNGTAAFVLPGVQLMIFPVGLIITSVWLLLGVVAYGTGTYERMYYADMYKRRQVAMATRRGKTI
ncbi:hypothetical protein TOPH_05657 [Tolypocladium ophioglossoides CBS 100239]|uniref:Uncharacterized protein n=1 Tax=Tolypocladium ophioglossoides (strain CBS 100239) TaxID=1163406 RepID=A0A0L0N6B4_TOLOC|nr:hypothetical protein TOPH_05657 [Tolypocladium ophioglossoides CBS 100239]